MKLSSGDGADGLADQSGIFEGDDSGEGNQMAKGENLRGLIRLIAEAMKHAAHLAGVGCKQGEQYRPRRRAGGSPH